MWLCGVIPIVGGKWNALAAVTQTDDQKKWAGDGADPCRGIEVCKLRRRRLNGGDVAVHAGGIEPSLGGAGGGVGINDAEDLRGGSGVGESGEDIIGSAGARGC